MSEKLCRQLTLAVARLRVRTEETRSLAYNAGNP